MKTSKQPKQYSCRICKKPFFKRSGFQKVCDIHCAIELVKQTRQKAEKKELRERKLKAKSRSQWLKEAQVEVNKYIRLRDGNLPCISCQRFHTGQYHAGHYRTIGSQPALRFDELNIHKQCAPCNNHLSGNLIEYRINLIKKIGLDKVEWLEGKHEPKKYTIDEIIAIKALYKQKIRG